MPVRASTLCLPLGTFSRRLALSSWQQVGLLFRDRSAFTVGIMPHPSIEDDLRRALWPSRERPAYGEAIEATAARLRATLRWLNEQDMRYVLHVRTVAAAETSHVRFLLWVELSELDAVMLRMFFPWVGRALARRAALCGPP